MKNTKSPEMALHKKTALFHRINEKLKPFFNNRESELETDILATKEELLKAEQELNAISVGVCRFDPEFAHKELDKLREKVNCLLVIENEQI
jgi:hypothetical protein